MSTTRTVIIGFGNKMRQGKDTAIGAIVQKYGYVIDIAVYGFGNLVREEVPNHVPSLPPHVSRFLQHEGLIRPPGGPVEMDEGTYRRALQFHSTFRRQTDSRYWLRKVAKLIAEDSPEVALLSGIRMRQELGWVQSKGGVFIRVIRTGYTPDVVAAADITETELDDVEADTTLVAADGDIEGLGRQAAKIFEGMLSTALLRRL